METVKFAGVVPLAGVTLSQELPEVTVALTAVPLEDEDPIVNVWEAGAELPTIISETHRGRTGERSAWPLTVPLAIMSVTGIRMGGTSLVPKLKVTVPL